MKKLFILLTTSICILFASCGAKPNAVGWYEDFDAAKKAAKSGNKNILLFVNSDNDAEGTKNAVDGLIASTDFIKLMSPKYVCVHFDFTNLDTILGDIPENSTNKEQKEIEKQQAKLYKQFKVADSYMIQETPAIVLVSQEGYFITDVTLDYMGFSAEAYASNIALEDETVKEFVKKVAATKTGSKLDKVRAIDALYESMAENHRILIADLAKKVPVYDKDNQTGLVSKYIVAIAHADVYDSLIKGTPEKSWQIYETAANHKQINPEDAQSLFYLAASMIANTGLNDIDKMLELLEKAMNVAPESEYAKNLKQVYDNVLSIKLSSSESEDETATTATTNNTTTTAITDTTDTTDTATEATN